MHGGAARHPPRLEVPVRRQLAARRLAALADLALRGGRAAARRGPEEGGHRSSAAGTRALDYTKAFFEKKYVPANSSTKSNAYADTTWLAGTTAMVSAGNFLLPEFAGAKFDWGVTYLPKDKRGADDLGGNALVATADSDNTDLATEFLKFMASDDAMSTFCGEALELPTLTVLVGKDLGWNAPDGVMPVFVDQVTTITAEDVAQLTVPAAAQITNVLDEPARGRVPAGPVDGGHPEGHRRRRRQGGGRVIRPASAEQGR